MSIIEVQSKGEAEDFKCRGISEMVVMNKIKEVAKCDVGYKNV